jgi:hypothetical protein
MKSKILIWTKKPENLAYLSILLAAIILGTIKYNLIAILITLLAAVFFGLYLGLMVRLFGRHYPAVGILLGLVILVMAVYVVRQLFF